MSDPDRLSFEVIDETTEAEDSSPDRVPQQVFALQLNGVLHMIEHGMVGAVTSTEHRRMGGSILSMLSIHMKSGQVLSYGPVDPREAAAIIAMCFGHPLQGGSPIDTLSEGDQTGEAS